MNFLSSSLLLPIASKRQLQRLCQVLWDWKICLHCESGQECEGSKDCCWARSGRLKRFFDFYKDVTSSYVPDLTPGCQPALRNHEDVLEIIKVLRANPDATRSQITGDYLSTRIPDGHLAPPTSGDLNRAFNIAVKVMTTLSCSAADQSSTLLELGVVPVRWRDDRSLREFISEALPPKNHFMYDEKSIQTPMTAKVLQKVVGLKIKPTVDLRNHLRLDHESGTLQVFHLTAFLKEHLTLTQPSLRDPGAAIPRELALETLSSLHEILFPSDHASQAMLRMLVARESFDPDCATFESAPYRRDGDASMVAYSYLGEKLADLHDAIENPQPRGILEKWLERRSGARYVMMATLVGVLIAVLLGFLSLAVGIFQAWVAYQQWKHPVPVP